MNPLSAVNVAAPPQYLADMPARVAQGPMRAFVPSSDLAQVSPGETTSAPAPSSFSNVLGRMVEEVNSRQVAAENAVTGVLTGQNVSLHQAMIAVEEASVSFQLMVEVRNRLLESYQEIMRMQV